MHIFSVTESAKKENRKEFNRMLKLSTRYKIKHLIFKSLDRMTRNLIDLTTIEKMRTSNKAVVHFFQDHKTYNEDINHNDKFELGIQGVVGKYWSDKISNDVKKGNLFKAENGVAPGRSPYGYCYDLEKKIHFINKDVEQDVRFIFDEFDKGKHSILDFAELINARGIKTGTGRKWTKGNLHTLLINPFYHGEFFFKNQIWQGNQEPYYSKQRYEARMKKFGLKFLGQKKRDCEFPLSKFLKCSVCGKILIGEIKKGRYIYYQHACPDKPKRDYRPEKKILDMIDHEVRRVRYSEYFADFVKEYTRFLLEEQRTNRKTIMAQISRKISKIEAEQEKLLDLYTSDSIPKELLEKKMIKYTEEIKALEAQKQGVWDQNDQFLRQVVDIIDTLKDMPLIYLQATTEGKAEIIRSMATGILVGEDTVQILWKAPYSYLVKNEILEYKKKIETAKTVEKPDLDTQ